MIKALVDKNFNNYKVKKKMCTEKNDTWYIHFIVSSKLSQNKKKK